eukprot:INCI17799.2.p1 GENE.INCI17799.2~~INCI17799.2.p1  ORF type:complete len:466 (-),score=40.14 INCI17799.2:549-1946(-)
MASRTAHRPTTAIWVHQGGVRRRVVHAPPLSNADLQRSRSRSRSPLLAGERPDRSNNRKTNGRSASPVVPLHDVAETPTKNSFASSFVSPASIVDAVVQQLRQRLAHKSPVVPNDSRRLQRPTSATFSGRPDEEKKEEVGDNPMDHQHIPIRFAARHADYHNRNPFALMSQRVSVSPVAVPGFRAAGEPAAVRNASSILIGSPPTAQAGTTINRMQSPRLASRRVARSKSSRAETAASSRFSRPQSASPSNNSVVDGISAEVSLHDNDSKAGRTLPTRTRGRDALDPTVVERLAQRIMCERARLHHDDPNLHLSDGGRAAIAKQAKHRKPENRRPKFRDSKDGPLGAERTRADKVNLLEVAEERARWGSRECACNTFPCDHVARLPANNRSLRVRTPLPSDCTQRDSAFSDSQIEGKQGGVTIAQLQRRGRAHQKHVARQARQALRRQANLHNQTTFHRGRTNGC